MCPCPPPSSPQPLLCYFGTSGFFFFYYCALGRKGIKLLAWVQPGEGGGCWSVSLCRAPSFSRAPTAVPRPSLSLLSCFAWGELRGTDKGKWWERPTRLQGARGTSLWVRRRERVPHLNSSLGITVSQSLISQSTTPQPISPAEVPLSGKQFLESLSPPSPDPQFHFSCSQSPWNTSPPRAQESWEQGPCRHF